jgi:hypothetical protein
MAELLLSRYLSKQVSAKLMGFKDHADFIFSTILHLLQSGNCAVTRAIQQWTLITTPTLNFTENLG